jgi:hypothetical protein
LNDKDEVISAKELTAALEYLTRPGSFNSSAHARGSPKYSPRRCSTGAEFGMKEKRILPTVDGLILISGVDAIVQR